MIRSISFRSRLSRSSVTSLPTDLRWRTLEVVEQITQERGSTPSAIALAWLLGQPGVTAPILGARSVEQLEACLEALKVNLTPDQLARLDAASVWEPVG